MRHPRSRRCRRRERSAVPSRLPSSPSWSDQVRSPRASSSRSRSSGSTRSTERSTRSPSPTRRCARGRRRGLERRRAPVRRRPYRDQGPGDGGGRRPLTNCSDLYEDFTPDYDGYVVRRFREAGFVLVGRTASPEFGIVPVTESRRFGPTRNPWDTSRTPGGSSGGSGAAVAAGMVPVAHASDGGGSIRIPASCCGLVGLKASRSRISPGRRSATRSSRRTGCAGRSLSGGHPRCGRGLGPAMQLAPPPSAPLRRGSRA